MWWPHFHQWWRSGPSLWPMREPGCSFHIRLGRQWPLSLLDEERNWSFATPPWQQNMQNGICIVCARHVPGPRIRNWQAERSVKYQWVKSCSAGAHYCQNGLRGCQLQEGQEIRPLCLPTGRPSLGLPDHQEISQNHLSKRLPKYAKVSSAETAAQNAVNLTGDRPARTFCVIIWIIWVWNAAMPRPSWIPSPSVSKGTSLLQNATCFQHHPPRFIKHHHSSQIARPAPSWGFLASSKESGSLWPLWPVKGACSTAQQAQTLAKSDAEAILNPITIRQSPVLLRLGEPGRITYDSTITNVQWIMDNSWITNKWWSFMLYSEGLLRPKCWNMLKHVETVVWTGLHLRLWRSIG